jgi:hypothetical protein
MRGCPRESVDQSGIVMTGRRGDFHLRGTRSLRHKVPIGVILRRVRSRRAGIHIRALWLPAAHMCISVANVSPLRSRAANTSSHVESMCIGLPAHTRIDDGPRSVGRRVS